jgi:hypothetical protein
MTECNQSSFEFASHFQREVVARFDGGMISSDAGALLLRKVEQRAGIVRQFAACFEDHRQADRVEHSVAELVRQRVYGLALGYEDLNDHDQLRADPLMVLLSGKADLQGQHRRREQDRGKAGAGKSTLNRLELTPAKVEAKARYKKIVLDEKAVDKLLVDLYIQAQPSNPGRIVLDLDATDDPIHGQQEGAFFHGYYGGYCYLPLYIFSGDYLLCARLRPSNIDASAGVEQELDRIVEQLRRVWPDVEIVVRADSGFCRESILHWCEEHKVDYVIGLAKNKRLSRAIGKQVQEAKVKFDETKKAARVFTGFNYKTRKSWSRERRVIAKAEHLSKGENPRFVVTSMTSEQMEPRALYEDFYCQRGEMENRIKEQQLAMFADRTSTALFRSNQIRLYFSSIAYCLMEALRRLGLAGTEMARSQCQTIRLKLLKVGAQIRITTRKIWISMGSGHPGAGVFAQVYDHLNGLAPMRE